MGNRGSRVVEFFRELNAEVNSASLPTLDWRSMTIYNVLEDLDASKPEEVIFSNYNLNRWREFEERGSIFDLPACEAVIVKFWEERKEAKGLIGGGGNPG